ncbi:unnamed protein product [Ilex paraguariensis]|uniref:non-specific serine/threonine protein kinase n=1 Tax=Ilex paraguariensis TaxID=185542 RepID=A0ABC8R8D0_9AQUA
MASQTQHHLASFLFTGLLYTFVDADSVKPPLPACPSFNCGSLTLSYPFWQTGGAQQSEYCGYPTFGVSCAGQEPQLHLSDHLYRVKQIDYSANCLTVAYSEVNGRACPKAPHGFTLDTSSFFNYTTDDKIVRFFYNCSLFPPSLQDIECLRYGVKHSYVFLEGAIPEFDWQRYCESTVIVPVIEKTVEGALVDGFGRALEDGFELIWKSESACQLCEASGGYCGYRNGTYPKFSCFCSDGRHVSYCHNDIGEVSIKSEQNFVAIGVLILGALIMASTVFYLIQKKRIGVQKHGFSQIPTGGKLAQ